MSSIEDPLHHAQPLETNRISDHEPDSEIFSAEFKYPILVDDKIRGLEAVKLSLSEFLSNHAFEECFFTTESGNIYCIFKDEERLAIMDARSNTGNGAASNGRYLSEQDVTQAVVERGRPFRCGQSNTTVVTQIIIVTDAHFIIGDPTPAMAREIAEQEAGGRMTDIRSRFMKTIFSKA